MGQHFEETPEAAEENFEDGNTETTNNITLIPTKELNIELGKQQVIMPLHKNEM